jgi:superfamily II DNA/RNA helicase
LKDPILTTENTPQEIAADAEVSVTFKELGLDPKIIRALDDMGYERPTPIQAHAIPHALAGKDVLGIAQTGTGKTGAFTLPTVHKLAKGRARARMPRCLIVCPTRELAAQVAENVELYGKYLKLEMALLIGGVSFAEQDKKLMRGVDVLIATPGRLLDQFERGKILLNGVQTLVVDEADRMLDMGFIPDIERIFEITPFTRQVLFFSATMPNEIKRLVQQFLHQPETIQVARKNMTAKTVTQRIVRLPKSDAKLKRTALRWIIDNEDVDNGIVFCNRKRDVDIVAKSLNKHGHSAAPIHGDLAQSLRTETLDDFKNDKIKILVASDVAARGLDVPSVSHVFNYDVPSHAEDYVHRIGRTGRAGRKGDTVMLVGRLDEKNYDAILDMIKVKEIEELEIPGIEDFPTEGKARRGGRNDRGPKGRGRGDRKSGGRDRNRSRNHNSGGGGQSRPAPKREEPVAEAVEAAPTLTKAMKDSSRTRRAPAGRKKPEEAKADVEPPKAEEAKTTTARDSSRTRKAPAGRRKAPEGRKKAEAPAKEAEAKIEDNPAKEKTRSRRAPAGRKKAPDDAPRRAKEDSRQEGKDKNESKRGRSKQSSNKSQSKSPEDVARANAQDNERANKKRSGKRHHDKGQKEDFAGFGDDMPAFFKNSLK